MAYNRIPNPPRKSLFSYLLPFLIIIGMGVLVTLVYNFMTSKPTLPELMKDAKVYVSIENGGAQANAWGKTSLAEVRNGDTLFQGDTITTGNDSRVVLNFFDKSIVRLGADTKLILNTLRADESGQQVTVTLERGSAWVVKNSADSASDFVFVTANTISSLNDTIMAVDVLNGYENVYVINGKASLNVVQEDKITNKNKSLQKFELETGEQILFNAEKIAALASGGYIPPVQAGDTGTLVSGTGDNVKELTFREPISESFRTSEWFTYNASLDGDLFVFENETVANSDANKEDTQTEKPAEENLSEEILTLTSPKENDVFNINKVILTGRAWGEKVQKVMVNNKVAELKDGVWSCGMTLDQEGANSFAIVAYDAEDGKLKELKVGVVYDITPPAKPVIVKPEDNSTQTNAEGFVIEGTATADTQKVVMTDSAQNFAYTLSAYLPGETTWKYNARASFGNLKEGENTYNVVAIDKAGNKSEATVIKVIYQPVKKEEPAQTPVAEEATQDETKTPTEETPVKTGGEETTSTETEATEQTNPVEEIIDESLPKPIITIPTAESTYTTALETVSIGGTTNQNTAKIYVNGVAIANYTVGTTRWNTSVNLTEGENKFTVVAENTSGQKSESSAIVITYK